MFMHAGSSSVRAGQDPNVTSRDPTDQDKPSLPINPIADSQEDGASASLFPASNIQEDPSNDPVAVEPREDTTEANRESDSLRERSKSDPVTLASESGEG